MSKHLRLGTVAVIPFWSQSDNMNADSNYAYLRIVLPEMVKQTEETIFLLFFPDPSYGSDRWVYTPDGLQSERIIFFPWNYDTAMASSVTGFDTTRFAKLEEGVGPLVYWLNQVESGAFVYGGYKHPYNAASMPTLVYQHHYIIHRSLPYVYQSLFPRQWLQIGGSLGSDAVVYNSDYCRQMANESFGEYLNGDTMKRLNAKSKTLRFALLTGDEPRAPEATEKDKPVFIYNHRFEYYKNPDDTFELFDFLRQSFDFEVWASQTLGQKTKKYKFDKSIYKPSRADYLANMAVPAINTINSIHETFCISILDSIAMGHIVVAPNRLTFPELLPPDYPYLFKDRKEQSDMLISILNNWPKDYNYWRTKLQEHAHTNFNLAKYVDEYLQLIGEAEQPHRETNYKDNTIQSLNKLYANMEKGKQYSVPDLTRVMHRLSGLQTQAMPARRVVREAMTLRDDIHLKWDGGLKIYKR